MRRALVVFVAAVGVAGCGSSSSSKGKDMAAVDLGGVVDLSVPFDAAGDAASSVPDLRVANTDLATAGDGGLTAVLHACDTPFRVDTSATIYAGQGFNAFWHDGKYLFTWVSSPGQGNARFFDGTNFGPTINLGTVNQAIVGGTDANGVVYFGTQLAATAPRWTYDLRLGSSATPPPSPSPFPLVVASPAPGFSEQKSLGIGVSPVNAISLYSATGGTKYGVEKADIYSAGDWHQSPYTITNVQYAENVQISLNAQGQGGATWTELGASSSENVYIAPFDGAVFASPSPKLFTSADADDSAVFAAAALSNGDLAFAWRGSLGESVLFSTFHAATGQWDAPFTVAPIAVQSSGGQPIILADSHDRVTVAWGINTDGANIDYQVYVRRRIGGVWGAVQTLDAGRPNMALDPSENVVSFTGDSDTYIRRAAADSYVFSAPITTGLPNSSNVTQPLATFAFTPAGDPMVVTFIAPGAPQPQSVSAVICH